jgi:hypothetical protein
MKSHVKRSWLGLPSIERCASKNVIVGIAGVEKRVIVKPGQHRQGDRSQRSPTHIDDASLWRQPRLYLRFTPLGHSFKVPRRRMQRKFALVSLAPFARS